MLALASIGVFFMVISAIGVLRMPDIFTRIHTLGKAATLGVMGVLLSVGIYFYAETGVFFRMILLVILFFITAPIAATALGRAAYRRSQTKDLALVYDDMAHHSDSAIPPFTTEESLRS